LKQLPTDPVIHEVRAVTLFALGHYKSSAAALNSFLSSAPGMDWTTMSSLYGNADDYQAQLRALEQFCRANPNDPAAYFVLAYQYLVLGEKDAAVKALQVVTKNQPKDATAKRMLDALAPPADSGTPSTPAPPTIAGADQPQTDLVGTWRASAGDSTIELKVTEDFQFTWTATQAGKTPIVLKGNLAADGDELALQTADQGAMSGDVNSEGPDAWKFRLAGAPASDPGLQFKRVKI
jgi:tetratricopeptide (TPR) repeat protein